MEPTDLYNKSKRNLVTFTALLALVLLGAIQMKGSATLYGNGIQIRPELLPTILFVLVLWLLYQFFIARLFQADEIRNRLWHDFFVTSGLAVVTLLGYHSTRRGWIRR